MIMDIYSLVECVLGASLMIYGLCVFFQPQRLQSLFSFLLREDEKSMFLSFLIPSAFLPWGLIAVFTHNDWTFDFSIIATILGWVWTFKACMWLLIPETMRKIFRKALPLFSRTKPLFAGGALALILGALVFAPYFSPLADRFWPY